MFDSFDIKQEKIQFFKNGIQNWIVENGLRDFPWRNTSSKFEILVSEILLRRTKASKVSEMWDSFFTKYQSFQDILLHRDELRDDISQLGLATIRSRGLIKMAEQIDHEIPTSENELLDLNGVGLYAARMLPLMLDNKRNLIFDSNFRRIYNRFFDLSIIKDLKRDPIIEDLSDKIIPKVNPRDFVLGILDFGALICRPRGPECHICPLSENCSYFLDITDSPQE